MSGAVSGGGGTVGVKKTVTQSCPKKAAEKKGKKITDRRRGFWSRRGCKASHCTFIEVEASAAAFDAVVGKFFGWVNATHEFIQPGSLIAQMKRRHWLLAPDEVEV